MSDSTSVSSPKTKESNEPVVEVSVDPEEWDALVTGASDGTIFHLYGFLTAMAEESRTTLVPLLLRKGGKVIGLWPVFLKNLGLTKLGFSPPPGTLVPNLGPVILEDFKHQADRERHYGEAISSLTEYIVKVLKPGLLRFCTTRGFSDARPFQWAGFRAEPSYTYVLDLKDGTDKVLQGFKKQLRTDARRAAQYENLDVSEGDFETYREIIALTRSRYAEQGEIWAPSNQYLERIFHRLNDDGKRVRCWSVREGKTLLSGVIVLWFNGQVAHWIGGVRYDAPYIGLNEFLHRIVIEEAVASGIHTYEMIGGNTERLCRHKSRYNPQLSFCWILEKRMIAMGMLYELVDSKSVRRFIKWMRK